MDPMVSARVPVGLRDPVNKQLREIGSSPTELINRAYEFFLKTGKLPGESSALHAGQRILNVAQAQKLQESIDCTTYPVDECFFNGKYGDYDYGDILADELRAEYEALS